MEFRERVHSAVEPEFMVVASHATTVRALELEVAARPPRLVLLHEAWLRDFGLDWLTGLQQFDPAPEILLVSQHSNPTTVAFLIPRGLRGLLPPDSSVDEIGQAIRKVVSGELWLSRRLMLSIMSTLATRDREDSSGTWQNLPSLTEREHLVLNKVLQGCSNKQIASALEISEQTVKVHLQHIYQKLGVHRRTDLLVARS